MEGARSGKHIIALLGGNALHSGFGPSLLASVAQNSPNISLIILVQFDLALGGGHCIVSDLATPTYQYRSSS
jgi:hypothetical protein